VPAASPRTSCATLAGLALRSRALGKSVKPAGVADAHRFLALLALLAIGVHGVALLNDTSIRIDLPGLLVPGRIPYRPVWVGAGIVAAELTVLVYASFSVRKRIGVRTWRRLHWLTYGIFAAVTVHGLLSGSDSAQPWARDVYLASIGSVAGTVAFRMLMRGRTPRLAAARASAGRDEERTQRRATAA
jgi:sulfoxide reductase heme-binding subunit YedZ